MTSEPINNISFCIITDGQEPLKLQRVLNRIRVLKVPHSEIILVGALPRKPPALDYDIFIPAAEQAAAGRLGAMRNIACRAAAGDLFIVLDDDMIFQKDFYAQLKASGFDWDVLCVNILNPDGSRFWGWASNIAGVSILRSFADVDDGTFYATGGMVLMKRRVFKKVQWNDSLGFYQGEDVDFSARLHAAGYRFTLNKNCVVVHDAGYTQVGNGVRRL